MSSPSLRRGRLGSARAVLLALATIALPFSAPTVVSAQQPARTGGAIALSLDDALRIAQQRSQTIDVARAGVGRAEGQRTQSRSQLLPQLSAQAGYTRTLATQFSSFADAAPVDTAPKPIASNSLCTPFVPATATAAERAAAIAQAASCESGGGTGGFDLSRTSFAARNLYQVGFAFSQNVYGGGRFRAQNDVADAQLRSANIEVNAQRAQLSLDVTTAYYDAVLADQLVAIADSSLAETEAVLAQTRVARQVGNASEFELLRAQVTRDNQLPVRIQTRLNVALTQLRLKQLLNMPLDDSVVLTTRIESPSGPSMPTLGANVAPDTSALTRAGVRQLDEAIRVNEAQVRIAKSQRIPSLSIVSNYQRLYFPSNVFPTLSNGVNNWTAGLSTSFPILDGGRIKGDVAVAEAGLAQARAQRDQAKEFASFDARVAMGLLAEAEAQFEASRGTAEQAQRAYAIDQVRFQEGISTQTDLSASRLLLEQARTNRARAARDLAVARVRLALLRDLPLNGANGATVAGAAQQGQIQQMLQQQQQPQGSNAAARGQTPGGIQP